ncbi:hypothetical protein AVEN_238435-1 [Araneus ventricosus]|uniref:Uncharacterized protein n=1 Tax=Araneus ventricosus TaxID=182803 RepID=A0A4Y2M7I1_ARAVE|nr:hypothetical protein AVEN_238435-1 [Araneus ventricosus]
MLDFVQLLLYNICVYVLLSEVVILIPSISKLCVTHNLVPKAELPYSSTPRTWRGSTEHHSNFQPIHLVGHSRARPRKQRIHHLKQGRRGQEKKSITYGHSDPLRLLHLFLLPLSETGLPQWFCDFLFRERASGSFPTFLNLSRFSFLAQLS